MHAHVPTHELPTWGRAKPLWARFVTADRVQTTQTGGLEKRPQRCLCICRHENNFSNRTQRLSVPLLTPCPRVIISSRPRGVLWQWEDQRWQEGSDTLVTAALQKLELSFSYYENATQAYPHPGGADCTVDANSSSHPAAAAAAAELLLSRIGWGSQVPPPAEAPHLSIQSCLVFITISHLSANWKALGDSENKTVHRFKAIYRFKNLTAIVLLCEHMPLLHVRFNYMLKFYGLQWDRRICLTFIMRLSVFSQ